VVGKKVSAPIRAWEDTWKWILGSRVALILLAVVGGVLGAIIIPSRQTLIERALYGGLGAIVTIFLILLICYVVQLQIAPYRQRNEAWGQIDELLGNKIEIDVCSGKVLADFNSNRDDKYRFEVNYVLKVANPPVHVAAVYLHLPGGSLAALDEPFTIVTKDHPHISKFQSTWDTKPFCEVGSKDKYYLTVFALDKDNWKSKECTFDQIGFLPIDLPRLY